MGESGGGGEKMMSVLSRIFMSQYELIKIHQCHGHGYTKLLRFNLFIRTIPADIISV